MSYKTCERCGYEMRGIPDISKVHRTECQECEGNTTSYSSEHPNTNGDMWKDDKYNSESGRREK